MRDIAKRRRSCLRIDLDRPVEATEVERLCDLAVWAPNHHRTEPWRFAAFVGDGRTQLGAAIADEMAAAGAPDHQVAKTRTKYLRAPVVLVVGSAQGSTPLETEENHLATAAAIQTLLLGATALGLHSFWGSVATPTSQPVLNLCGYEAGTRVLAAIYIGHPLRDCSPGERGAPRINWIE